MPFNNMTNDKYAGEKLKNAVVMEILVNGVFEVAEDGEVNRVVSEVFKEMGFMGGELVSLDVDAIKRIAEKLRVNALFIGTVESYGQEREGGTPYSVVSFSLRLVEATTGTTIWWASYTQEGRSFLKNIFGIKQKNERALTRDVVKNLLGGLF